MLEVELKRTLASFELQMRLEVGAEILAVFGPSGAGKSMLLKMIAGIEPPDSGYIRSSKRVLYDSVAGINLPARHRKVGYVPQQYALFPHLTAQQNVEFPLRKGLGKSSHEAQVRARGLLESFGLGNLFDTYPRRLSGGQQQRVALARALASEPEILLLDEPFAALDAPIRVELREELRELQKRLGIPALFVTHDLEEAAAISGSMAVIFEGRIRQNGTVREIVERPVDLVVAKHVQSRNIIPGVIRRDHESASLQTQMGRLRVNPGTFADGARVSAVVRPEAIRIVAELEDVASPSTCSNEFSASVIERRDEGLRATCLVNVAGTRLLVSLPRHLDAHIDVTVGTSTRIEIAVADLHLIPDHDDTVT